MPVIPLSPFLSRDLIYCGQRWSGERQALLVAPRVRFSRYDPGVLVTTFPGRREPRGRLAAKRITYTSRSKLVFIANKTNVLVAEQIL